MRHISLEIFRIIKWISGFIARDAAWWHGRRSHSDLGEMGSPACLVQILINLNFPFISSFLFSLSTSFSFSLKWDDAYKVSCSEPSSIKHMMIVIFIIKGVQRRRVPPFPTAELSVCVTKSWDRIHTCPWGTRHHARRLCHGHQFPLSLASPRNGRISKISALGNPGKEMRVSAFTLPRALRPLSMCAVDIWGVWRSLWTLSQSDGF